MTKIYPKTKHLAVTDGEIQLIKQALSARRRTYLEYAKNRNDKDFLILAYQQKKIIHKLEAKLQRG